MSEATITIYFNWTKTTPDPRQFQQQRHELEPLVEINRSLSMRNDLLIAVEIPLQHDYIYNSEKIEIAQMSSDENVPDPILTPKGLQYAVMQLEAPWQAELHVPPSDDEFDWSEETVTDKEPTEEEEFLWGNEASEDEETTEENFDWDE